jgi:hypothetical protein
VLRRAPTIQATLGDATATRHLAVVDNLPTHTARHLQRPGTPSDPLPEPPELDLLAGDDDE